MFILIAIIKFKVIIKATMRCEVFLNVREHHLINLKADGQEYMSVCLSASLLSFESFFTSKKQLDLFDLKISN